MVRKKIYSFKKGRIIEGEEYIDGRYGAPGCKRLDKKKATEEQVKKVNAYNKAKRCRHRLLEYFSAGDIFATLTYEAESRPPDMKRAVEDFRRTIRIIRNEYKKRDRQLFWIRNIEQGSKGAWHIHLVINRIDDTPNILMKAWEHGGVWMNSIKLIPKIYDEDFSKLASYMTKDENTREKKHDGTYSKPRLKAASYSTSRNMPLPEAKTRLLVRWKSSIKPYKGYYIAKIYEGENPAIKTPYRRYTMIRLDGGDEDGEDPDGESVP